MTASECRALLSRFVIEGDVVEITPFGHGHINGTFRVVTDNGKQYILQSINHHIFKNVEGLMSNIAGVTGFLRSKISKNGGDPDRETLPLILTKGGKTHYYAEDGTPWRVYRFIENTITLQSVEKPEDFYFSAKAFANFTKMLSTYPAEELCEVIPSFHNTKVRYYNLMKAIHADRYDRVKNVKAEIDFAMDRIEKAGKIVDALDNKEIPMRVTHNDTKLNNVLIDKDSGCAICVCDLDTIMPGSILYDFGDAIRFGTNPIAEDDPNWQGVRCDLALFEEYVKGTMEVLKGDLTRKEVEFLPLGAWMMTLECGVRFLTDYLEGDVYFKTDRDGQNLDRCHTQFAMVADMEQKETQMRAIVNKYR